MNSFASCTEKQIVYKKWLISIWFSNTTKYRILAIFIVFCQFTKRIMNIRITIPFKYTIFRTIVTKIMIYHS